MSSICDADFAESLFQIGALTFGYKITFGLSHAATPDTVEVEVDGQACLTGWALVSNGQTIRFEPDGGCLPDAGQSIVIRYEPICLPP